METSCLSSPLQSFCQKFYIRDFCQNLSRDFDIFAVVFLNKAQFTLSHIRNLSLEAINFSPILLKLDKQDFYNFIFLSELIKLQRSQLIILFCTLRTTQPPSQWVPEALSLGVERLGRRTNHLSPCIAEMETDRTVVLLHHMSSWHNA